MTSMALSLFYFRPACSGRPREHDSALSISFLHLPKSVLHAESVQQHRAALACGERHGPSGLMSYMNIDDSQNHLYSSST